MSHITLPASPQMHWLTAADISARGYMKWRVRDIFPSTGYGVIAGEEGSGKTQILMDIAAHVAGFDTLWDHKIEQNCPVVYIMLEGQAGLYNRISAWETYYGISYPIGTDRVQFIDAGFSFYGEAAKSLIELQEALPNSGSFIIVDTLRTSSTGYSENSTDDMALVAEKAKALCYATQSFLLFAHHVDKKNGLVRGSTVITNNSDVVLKITSDNDNGIYTISSGRIKEAAGRSAITTFKHHPIEIGFYDDGERITSVVPEYQDIETDVNIEADANHVTTMSENRKWLYRILADHPDGMTNTAWKTEFSDQYIKSHPGGNAKSASTVFDREKKWLITNGFVLISDGIFTINNATSATNNDNSLLQIGDDYEFVEFGDDETPDTAATNATMATVAFESECNNSNVACVADTNISKSLTTPDVTQCAATATPPVYLSVYTGGVLQSHAAANAAATSAGGTDLEGEVSPSSEPRNSNSSAGLAVAVAQTGFCREGEEGLTPQPADDPTAICDTPAIVATRPTAQQDEPTQKPLPPSRQPSPAHHDATPPDRSNSNGEAPAAAVTVAEIPPAVADQIESTIQTFHAKITKIKKHGWSSTPEQPQQSAPRLRQKSLIPPSQLPNLPTGYQEGAA